MEKESGAEVRGLAGEAGGRQLAKRKLCFPGKMALGSPQILSATGKHTARTEVGDCPDGKCTGLGEGEGAHSEPQESSWGLDMGTVPTVTPASSLKPAEPPCGGQGGPFQAQPVAGYLVIRTSCSGV